jgi:hypothetical protein
MDSQDARSLRLFERVGQTTFWTLWAGTLIFLLGGIGLPVHKLFGIADPPNVAAILDFTDSNGALCLKTFGALLLVRVTLLFGRKRFNRPLLWLLIPLLLFLAMNAMPRY